ncbi:HD-GYP domain-containing protein [Roseibium sediminis]|uniref:HD-GYP domain-containing protein n=1 Tax=Roseibium sediminis TaxID=1775174 RepID=UPI00123D3E8A|nr:HD-GYP domain-containing protein [Roseibium sediminis]
MNVALIADGDVYRHPMFSGLPERFSCRLFGMREFLARATAGLTLVVVDIANASREGLQHLRNQLAMLSGVPVHFIATPGLRWEIVQANSFPGILLFDRRLGSEGLAGLLREHGRQILSRKTGGRVPQQTRKALLEGAKLLEAVADSVASTEKLPTRLLKQASESLTEAMAADGLMPWVNAVAHHHSGTYRHSLHVAGLTAAFSAELGWPVQARNLMAAGALLHDIGKMRISLSILDKPGRLTSEEFDEIKKHPVYSQDILDKRPEIPEPLKIMAVQHHEYLDGSGYPKGLRADQLCPRVRVLTICDVFSAMTETRAYKKAYPPEVAFQELEKMGGKLDQSLVKTFRKLVIDLEMGRINRREARQKAAARQQRELLAG